MKLELPESGLTLAFLAVWACIVVGIVGSVSGAHLLTLPAPLLDDARLAGALRSGATPNTWSMTHFLRPGCRCSRAIASYLARRGPLGGGVGERVLLVGDDDALRVELVTAGFTVVVVKEEELTERYGVEAVPLLAVADPAGHVRYAGGYTARKQGPVPADRAILSALQAGESPAVEPIFGCPTSERLKRATDPLGLR